MTLGQLINRKKATVAKKGMKPGKTKVCWLGYNGAGRREFRIFIPTDSTQILAVQGDCAFDESDVQHTHEWWLDLTDGES